MTSDISEEASSFVWWINVIRFGCIILILIIAAHAMIKKYAIGDGKPRAGFKNGNVRN